MKPKQSDSKTPKTGMAKEYFRNGQLCSIGHYVDGKKTGMWKYYLLNGKLKATGKFSNGEFTGLWRWYRESGNPLQVGKFKNGKQEGLWKRYHPMESDTTWVSTWMGKRRGCENITMLKEI